MFRQSIITCLRGTIGRWPKGKAIVIPVLALVATFAVVPSAFADVEKWLVLLRVISSLWTACQNPWHPIPIWWYKNIWREPKELIILHSEKRKPNRFKGCRHHLKTQHHVLVPVRSRTRHPGWIYRHHTASGRVLHHRMGAATHLQHLRNLEGLSARTGRNLTNRYSNKSEE